MKKTTRLQFHLLLPYMRRILMCCFLLSSYSNFAQFLVTSFSPSVQCYSQNGNSSTGMVLVPPPGAVTYTWMVTAPSPTCQPPGISSFSMDNSLITIYFTCCGVYSVDCIALDASMMVIDLTTSTVEVSCGSSISLNTAPANSVFCTGSSATLTASGASSYTWLPTNTQGASLSVNASGCYTVLGESNGCASEAVSCVTLQNVSFSVSPATQTICSAASATLTTSAANSYIWSTGATTNSIVVNPTVTSTYTVTAGIGNCVVKKTATVSVSTPSLSVSSNVAILCRGKSATLTASGGQTYTWSSSSTTLGTLVVSPTVTTNYTVVTKDAAGCKASTVKTQSVTVCLDVANTNPETPEMILFPNPMKNRVTLERKGLAEILSVEIYDLQGQKIMTREGIIDILELDLTDYPPGLFFIKVCSKNEATYYKLVKSAD